MAQKIFVDTSVWIALTSKNDKNHQLISDFLPTAISRGAVFFTSNDVIDETITRLIYDVGLHQAQKFIDEAKLNIQKRVLAQLWTDEQIQIEAMEILEKFSDPRLSMTDVTTIAIMKRFNLDAILTLDSDFKKIGIRCLP